ncbi:hypothetical protein K438DRAFT_1782927 [Mycena galopus ATCC 62051]|nr:hypothetical protein K438DRAFT_1782927 [Mycena galopus ATCC 62051]
MALLCNSTARYKLYVKSQIYSDFIAATALYKLYVKSQIYSDFIAATALYKLYAKQPKPPLVSGGCFDFTSLNAAKVVGAVPEMGQPAAHYVWYSALDDKWLRVGSPVSLRGRGSYMILRNGSVPEDACPGLLGFVVDTLKSILDEAGGKAFGILCPTTVSLPGTPTPAIGGVFADPELLTEDGQSFDFGFDLSVPPSPSLSSGNGSSPLKRRWTSKYEEEARAVVIEEDKKYLSKPKRPRLVGSMIEPIVLD